MHALGCTCIGYVLQYAARLPRDIIQNERPDRGTTYRATATRRSAAPNRCAARVLHACAWTCIPSACHRRGGLTSRISCSMRRVCTGMYRLSALLSEVCASLAHCRYCLQELKVGRGTRSQPRWRGSRAVFSTPECCRSAGGVLLGKFADHF